MSRRDYSATAQHQTCIHFSRLDVSVIKSHAKSFGEWGIYKLSDIAKKTVDGLDPLEPKQNFSTLTLAHVKYKHSRHASKLLRNFIPNTN